MDYKRIKKSLIINILIVIMTLFSSIMMFTGFKFMHGPEVVLESTKLGMFRFFTVDSNIFMGIVALIWCIKEIKILKGKKVSITRIDYLLKLMSTTAVGLTFLVVFLYLGPIAKDGIVSLLMNSNLFFHLIIPIISIITFVLYEKNSQSSFKDTFYGLIPTMIYAIYYIINVLVHMENGFVSPKYDFYWFVQNGVWTAIFVVPIIFILTYMISLIIWKLNKIKNSNN